MIQRVKYLIKRVLRIPGQLEILKKKGLKVGTNFHMQEGCNIDFSHSFHIEIGNDVSLAPNVHILAHDASTWWFLGYTKIKNVTIGNRVFIGAGSIVLPGVNIGNDVIVGAGSVVTKSIPDNCVFAGNPAKFISNTDVYIAREKKKMNHENCFGREYSEANDVSDEKKKELKEMAAKHGTAFAE